MDASTNALSSTNTYYEEDIVFTGDFNGDGRADMLVQWRGENDKRQLLLYRGNANGTFSAGVNFSSERSQNPERFPAKFYVADVNGDGKDDFVVHWKNESGFRCALVYKGQASSPYFLEASPDAIVTANSYVESDPVFVSDVNGDGRDDMIVHWALNGYRQFLIYIANSDGTYQPAIRQSTSNQHNPAVFAGVCFIADVNGDGRDDLIVKWKNGSNVQFLTYLGTPSGSFSAAVRTAPLNPIPYYL